MPQELGCGCGMTCWRRLRDWLHRYRRLLVRYERRAAIHLGCLELACCLITFRFVAAAF